MRASLLVPTAALSLWLLALPAPTPAQPDYDRAERATLAAELDRARAGRECIDPEDAPTLPRWVVVSWMTDGRMVSNTAERLPFGEAWALAEDGEAYVRCVIV